MKSMAVDSSVNEGAAASTLTVFMCERSACAQTMQLFATVSPRPQFAALALDDANVYPLARDFSTLYVLPKP